jgi:molybdate transport system ATP-binding protein
MTLDAHVVIRRDGFTLDVTLDLAAGETLAVLGPNGSGKSTLLRALAGLQPIDEGRILIDDSVVDDPGTNTFVAPEHRNIGMVFQDHSLFDNLTAVERASAAATARSWLASVQLDRFAPVRPRRLSGGQAQRVALVRALAIEPRLLLLDEPMAALDARSRAEIRRDLRVHLADRDIATILVTHDPVDAFALADRVMVIEDGLVSQVGALDEVTTHPRTRHIADMVGLSLVRGHVRDGVLQTATGVALVVPADAPDGAAVASIRPGSVTLHHDRPEGSARNAWPMTVREVDRLPNRVRVRLEGPIALVAELTPSGAEALDPHPGAILWASVKASEIAIAPDLDS